MGTLEIMNESGDEKIVWNADDVNSVATARKKFEEFLAKGYTPFKMWSDKKGEQLKAFDQLAEKILFVAPMVGG